MGNVIRGGARAEIEVKRSRFIAEVRNCRSEEEAQLFLESVKKRERDARHHCFAYRIGLSGQPLERQSDDGEPQGTAGKPMLELLKGAELLDICAVVTRYFGGTLLGTGGLVRAYADALKKALSEAETGTLSEGVRLSVSCDYALSGKVKYLAQQELLYPEEERYTDSCQFFYLAKAQHAERFLSSMRELGGGRVRTERLSKVLYLSGERPEVYKVLK